MSTPMMKSFVDKQKFGLGYVVMTAKRAIPTSAGAKQYAGRLKTKTESGCHSESHLTGA